MATRSRLQIHAVPTPYFNTEANHEILIDGFPVGSVGLGPPDREVKAIFDWLASLKDETLSLIVGMEHGEEAG